MARYKDNRRVAKSNPEMQAVLANIDSLVDELQSLSLGDSGDGLDGAEGGFDDQQPVRGVANADEATRTPAAAQVVTNPQAPAKLAGQAPWEDDGVKKAMAVLKAAGFEIKKPEDDADDAAVAKAQALMKGLMASTSDGPTADENGEESVNMRPDVDDENIDEVKKALIKMLGLGGHTARKSAPQSRFAQTTTALIEVTTSLADRVQKSDAILEEVLEGLGIAKAVTEDHSSQTASRQVAKSQGGRGPVMSYGDEFGEVVGASVAKALAPFLANMNQQSNLPPNWNRENDVQKSMGEAGLKLGELAGSAWGQRYSVQPEGKKE